MRTLALSIAALALAATHAQAECPPTRGLYPLAPDLGAHGTLLVEGDVHEVAAILTDKPTFITSDKRGTIQTVVKRQFGPKQALIAPQGGVPNGAQVSVDLGFTKGAWTVKPGPLAPQALRAVRRTHEQLPPNPGTKPAWRRWTLQVDGEASWVLLTGPGGGAGLFPVQADKRIFVEWGQCMRARHSLPSTAGVYSAQAIDLAGDRVGPVVKFSIPAPKAP